MVIIIVSIMIAILFMSGGYGFWQKQLIITGRIEVKQEPVAEGVLPQGILPTGGGGDMAIPNMPVDQTTDTETTAPINLNEPQTDGNSRGGAPQGETTEGIDNPGQQQSTDLQGESIGATGGNFTVDSTPTPEPGTSDSDSSADESSSSSNSAGDTTNESTDSDL